MSSRQRDGSNHATRGEQLEIGWSILIWARSVPEALAGTGVAAALGQLSTDEVERGMPGADLLGRPSGPGHG